MSQSSQTRKQSLLSQCPSWQHIGVVCELLPIGGAVDVAAGFGGAPELFVFGLPAVGVYNAAVDAIKARPTPVARLSRFLGRQTAKAVVERAQADIDCGVWGQKPSKVCLCRHPRPRRNRCSTQSGTVGLGTWSRNTDPDVRKRHVADHKFDRRQAPVAEIWRAVGRAGRR